MNILNREEVDKMDKFEELAAKYQERADFYESKARLVGHVMENCVEVRNLIDKEARIGGLPNFEQTFHVSPSTFVTFITRDYAEDRKIDFLKKCEKNYSEGYLGDLSHACFNNDWSRDSYPRALYNLIGDFENRSICEHDFNVLEKIIRITYTGVHERAKKKEKRDRC